MKTLNLVVLWLTAIRAIGQVPYNATNPGMYPFSTGTYMFNAINVNLAKGYNISSNAHITIKAKNEIVVRDGFKATNLSPSGEAHLMIDEDFTTGGDLYNNDFKIGLSDWGEGHSAKYRAGGNDPCANYNRDYYYPTALGSFGSSPGVHATSMLNVMSEDGFNVYKVNLQAYMGAHDTRNFIKMGAENKMQMHVGAFNYFHPFIDDYSVPQFGGILSIPIALQGINSFDNCGATFNDCESPFPFYMPNYDDFIDNIFTNNNFKDHIWGYGLSEECSYDHPQYWRPHPSVTLPIPNTGFDHNRCIGLCPKDGCPSSLPISPCPGGGNHNLLCGDFIMSEVPPSNVADAISHFKSKLSNNGHKIVLWEANHGKQINGSTLDNEGQYNPQDYISLISGNNSDLLFMDGSYVGTNINDVWANPFSNNTTTGAPHYLGKFTTLDFAKSFTSKLHVVEFGGDYDDIQPDNSRPPTYFLDGSPVVNANWLWFKAYTAIIHGAQGWWIYRPLYWTEDDRSLGREAAFKNAQNSYRFDRQNFPIYYQKYVSNLSKELRYLVNNNILSTDPGSILQTKTTNFDPWHIVPYAVTYNTYNPNIPNNLSSQLGEFQSENYGLRYTIRTNGRDIYMIITNPLGAGVYNLDLNFSSVPNNFIKNASAVEVLFDTGNDAVASNTYKINRNSNINLELNTIGTPAQHAYHILPINSGVLRLDFGPLDVKVLKFLANESDVDDDFEDEEQEGERVFHADSVRKSDMVSYSDDQERSIEINNFLIMPNPTENEVNLLFQDINPKRKISIIDSKGNEVFRVDNSTSLKVNINCTTLEKGLYLVRVFTPRGYGSRKLIIQ